VLVQAGKDAAQLFALFIARGFVDYVLIEFGRMSSAGDHPACGLGWVRQARRPWYRSDAEAR
jgi:hypothetical protein